MLCDAADADELSRLAEFAAETGCWALAATAPRTPVTHVEPVWHAADAPRRLAARSPAPSAERDARDGARLRQFRTLVGEWIARAAA